MPMKTETYAAFFSGGHNNLFLSVDFLGKSKGLLGIWKLVNCCIEQSV